MLITRYTILTIRLFSFNIHSKKGMWNCLCFCYFSQNKLLSHSPLSNPEKNGPRFLEEPIIVTVNAGTVIINFANFDVFATKNMTESI